jgi:hypothetical protein
MFALPTVCSMNPIILIERHRLDFFRAWLSSEVRVLLLNGLHLLRIQLRRASIGAVSLARIRVRTLGICTLHIRGTGLVGGGSLVGFYLVTTSPALFSLFPSPGIHICLGIGVDVRARSRSGVARSISVRVGLRRAFTFAATIRVASLSFTVGSIRVGRCGCAVLLLRRRSVLSLLGTGVSPAMFALLALLTLLALTAGLLILLSLLLTLLLPICPLLLSRLFSGLFALALLLRLISGLLLLGRLGHDGQA